MQAYDKSLRQDGITKPGELFEYYPGCRGHDVAYNEWHSLDDSSYSFKHNTNPVDVGSVEPWLSNIWRTPGGTESTKAL